MIAQQAAIIPEAEDVQGIKPPTEEQVEYLARDLREEVEDAISSRGSIDVLFGELLRQYDAQPKHPTRDIPIPNAPNIEVPIGAIAADAIYAQAIDTIFQISPVVTVRPSTPDQIEPAKALQRFIDWGVANEWRFREAASTAFLDDVQLGTGVYYIPWIEKRKKTSLGRKIVQSSPRMVAIPCEDFFVPGNAPQSLHDSRWLGHRSWLTKPELNYQGQRLGWDLDGVTQAGGDRGYVRHKREMLARTQETGQASRELYEIFQLYISYDIDEDGISEDLMVVWDRTSGNVLFVKPNPFDRARPYESMVYQPRPHIFNGIGVLEMLGPFQDAATEIHCQRLLNMLLANCRIWAGKEGRYNETLEVWPGRYLEFENPSQDIVALQMADVYPSSMQAEAIIMQYAERRSGLSDLQTGQGGNMGSRTPGITALSMIQQVNQRFTPAYDAMRDATSAAVRQCIYRYQERAMMEDPIVEDRLLAVLGREQADSVLELLRDPTFDDSYKIELTASSASVNRDSDRQGSLQLMQVLGTYYEQLLGLVNIASNPQVPQEVRTTVHKIISAAGEAMDRTIRTFDQVRDPAMFIIQLDEIYKQEAQQQGIQGNDIAAMLGQLAGQQGTGMPPEVAGVPGGTPPPPPGAGEVTGLEPPAGGPLGAVNV